MLFCSSWNFLSSYSDCAWRLFENFFLFSLLSFFLLVLIYYLGICRFRGSMIRILWGLDFQEMEASRLPMGFSVFFLFIFSNLLLTIVTVVIILLAMDHALFCYVKSSTWSHLPHSSDCTCEVPLSEIFKSVRKMKKDCLRFIIR